MILDLQKVWSVMNFIAEQENLYNEKDIYPDLLGLKSHYYSQSFNYLLEHYSFRIDKDEICVFNDDPVPYEDFTNSDFSYIPKELLDYNDQQLKKWIDKQVGIYLKRVEQNKQEEKENIKNQIKTLIERLEKL
jgi:hypothetical protein